jgi:small subunit ribosomal protein S13
MARTSGIDIFKADFLQHKHLKIALTYIFGVGHSLAKKVLLASNFEQNIKVKELTESQVTIINQLLKKICPLTENNLKAEISNNIKRLKKIRCYRGVMHEKGLPVRGQSTKRNARTSKGPRKTIANKAKTKAK